jgi:hypothetical protein
LHSGWTFALTLTRASATSDSPSLRPHPSSSLPYPLHDRGSSRPTSVLKEIHLQAAGSGHNGPHWGSQPRAPIERRRGSSFRSGCHPRPLIQPGATSHSRRATGRCGDPPLVPSWTAKVGRPRRSSLGTMVLSRPHPRTSAGARATQARVIQSARRIGTSMYWPKAGRAALRPSVFGDANGITPVGGRFAGWLRFTSFPISHPTSVE